MTQQFRWAFIGTGTLAKKVIKEITDSGRHKVVSAYSRNRDKLIQFCEPYAAYAATSVEDAISRSDVDAVYISVTNESHYDVCRLCLEKGKNVLLEKPFTINAAQTKALFDLARKKDVYLSEAMWTWYSDVPNKVREVVLSGKLGKIKSVAMSYSNYGINYAPRVSDPKKGGGAVLDIGIYPIAYAYRLFGLPNHISCKGDVHDGVDFSEKILFEYNGFDVKMEVSIVGSNGEYCVIEGENGILMNAGFHYAEPAILKIGDDISVLDGKRGYLQEFDAVADEIRQGRKESLFITPKMTFDCMSILDECRAQMNLVYPFET